jgi:hypothetical protein
MCASATRGPPVCFLSGGGRLPATAGFFLAVFSAVPGNFPALPGGRPLGLASFFVEVGSPGFWSGDFAPSLGGGGGRFGGLPHFGGKATAVSGGAWQTLRRCVDTSSALVPICN